MNYGEFSPAETENKMRTIHKYPLAFGTDFNGKQKVSMPYGAKVVMVAVQSNVITVWAEHYIDNANEIADREFYIFATGEEITNKSITHCGSVMFSGFVFHVYQKI